jgi:ribose/xylose/arabinose/galactoside ABC-type transport system permease subunit
VKRLAVFGPFLALAAVFTFFLVLVWSKSGENLFGSAHNMQTILLHSAITGTTALGMTLVIVAGGIDLSVGSVVAFSSVVVAWLLKHAGWGPWPAAAGGIATGALCGLVNGALVTGLRVVPFIVTLGTMLVWRGAAKALSKESPIYPDRGPLDGVLSLGGPAIWILAFAAAATAAGLRYTRAGRHVVAVGSNEAAARLCGVPVERTRPLVYTLGGAFAGLSGLFQYSRLSSGDPTAAPGHELDVIAAVVIGGASLAGGEGSILGSLVGALLMTTIRSGCALMDWRNYITEIVAGAIIVAAAALDRFRRRSAGV